MDLRYGNADENVRKRSIQDVILHERQRFENQSEKTEKTEKTAEDVKNAKRRRKPLPERGTFHADFGAGMEAAHLCPSRAGELAVVSSVNRLAAEGIRAKSISALLLLPAGTQEKVLRELVSQICRRAFTEGIEIGHIDAQVTDAVTRPIVISNAEGKRFCHPIPDPQVFEEKDIILAGPVGLEGTYILVCEQFKALQKRFPMSILARMRNVGEELCILKTAETAAEITLKTAAETASNTDAETEAAGSAELLAMVSLGEGGFFAGLWELSRKTGCGLDVDLQTLPLLQETIEITDYLGINPYAMRSAGSLLIAVSSADTDRLIQCLEQEGCIAVKIGKLTGNKDKIIRNGEDVRFLDRPQTDTLALWYRDNNR